MTLPKINLSINHLIIVILDVTGVILTPEQLVIQKQLTI